MNEATFTTQFQKYLRSNFYYSGCFEIKITKKDSIPFSQVKQHQIDNLLQVENHQLIYKISDIGIINYRPFDVVCLRRLPAYIVILFYQPRSKDNRFYAIRVNRWIEEESMTTHRKSLTKERADAICEFSGII